MRGLHVPGPGRRRGDLRRRDGPQDRGELRRSTRSRSRSRGGPRAWRTLGVIPPTPTSARRSKRSSPARWWGSTIRRPASSCTSTRAAPDPTAELTLAHELTHALEDQRFDLGRLDVICGTVPRRGVRGGARAGRGERDLPRRARRASAPGRTSTSACSPTRSEPPRRPPEGVPQFVYELQSWPYIEGPVVRAVARGTGRGAMRSTRRSARCRPRPSRSSIPRGTRAELPRDLDIPDLTPAIGPGWGDLDAMVVGEEWLRAMLALRLDRAARPRRGRRLGRRDLPRVVRRRRT